MTGTQAKRPSRKTVGRTVVFPTETVLPLKAEAYAVTQEGEIWRVMVKHSGEVLYSGQGPVDLVESPAPF